MVAADAALVVVDGVAGVEVQTEKVWGFADEFKLPRAIVINKLDRERSDFERALASCPGQFGRTAVPIQLPIGAEKDFKGVIDLVRMKAYTYASDGDGKGKEGEIPADLSRRSPEGARSADRDGGRRQRRADGRVFRQRNAASRSRCWPACSQAIRERRIYPVLCASGLHNIGSDLLLNFMVENFPAPTEREPIPGEAERPGRASGPSRTASRCPRSCSRPWPIRSPAASHISKSCRAIVKNDANLVNARTSGVLSAWRTSAALMGKTIQPVTELHAGDIGAVAKLKETLTGDTLGDKSSSISYPPVQLPEPSIAFAISAKTRQDEDRMGNAIQRILEEDQSLRFYRDPQTKEFLLAGSGQQHVEVIVSRLKKRYGVDVALKAPKIPYRETIRGKADVQGRHKKQTGGHGQFGDCWIRMEPLPRGAKFEFANEIFGGAIPRNYIPGG